MDAKAELKKLNHKVSKYLYGKTNLSFEQIVEMLQEDAEKAKALMK